jgi:hypothetical protein
MAERKVPRPVELLSSPGEGANALVDVDTFLTTLYVMIDDFCQTLALTPGV